MYKILWTQRHPSVPHSSSPAKKNTQHLPLIFWSFRFGLPPKTLLISPFSPHNESFARKSFQVANIELWPAAKKRPWRGAFLCGHYTVVFWEWPHQSLPSHKLEPQVGHRNILGRLLTLPLLGFRQIFCDLWRMFQAEGAAALTAPSSPPSLHVVGLQRPHQVKHHQVPVTSRGGKKNTTQHQPVESKSVAKSVVKGNAGDHNCFDLSRFPVSLVQLGSHKLDFPGKNLLNTDPIS